MRAERMFEHLILRSWLSRRQARKSIRDWRRGNQHAGSLVADERLARLEHQLGRSKPDIAVVRELVGSLWRELLEIDEEDVAVTGPEPDVLASLCWTVCDAMDRRRLITPSEMQMRRIQVWIGFAKSCVRYYDRLVQKQGDGWVFELNRARQFYALMLEDRRDLAALRRLADSVKSECGGSFFYLMELRLRGAIETLEAF